MPAVRGGRLLRAAKGACACLSESPLLAYIFKKHCSPPHLLLRFPFFLYALLGPLPFLAPPPCHTPGVTRRKS
jgi:hypothetical protein